MGTVAALVITASLLIGMGCHSVAYFALGIWAFKTPVAPSRSHRRPQTTANKDGVTI